MTIIKNKSELATTELRCKMIDIIEYGINEVRPRTLMGKCVQYNKNFNSITIQTNTFDLLSGRIFVVGGGKAAGEMTAAFEEIIGPEQIEAGYVTVPEKGSQTRKIEIIPAGHPLPDKKGMRGVVKMLELKEKFNIGKKDAVVCLLSGGGSSLLPSPPPGVSLKSKQAVTDLLITCGANIQEINTVRKHLSRVKGGLLARHFAPATVIAIIISDVAGDHPDVVASGPTMADPTTFNDAYDVLKRYGLISKIPDEARSYIEAGIEDKMPETPKTLDNSHNFIIGKNSVALEAMALAAKNHGFNPIIGGVDLAGDPKTAAERHIRAIKSGEYRDYDLVLFGGETTPRLPDKHGVGGRNQHYIASALELLKDEPGEWAVAALGTDGVDYIKDAAGAIIDHNTYSQCRTGKLDIEKYINNYDTFHLFESLGNSLVRAGWTGTNVCDAVIYALPQQSK